MTCRRHRLPIIAGVELKVGLEQIDDGQVGGRLAIRIGTGLEDQPAVGLMRADELIAQAGLSHPGLPDHPYHLPPPLPHLSPGGRPGWPTPARAPRIDSGDAAHAAATANPRTSVRPRCTLRGWWGCSVPSSSSHARSSHQPPTSRSISGDIKISPGSAYPSSRPGRASVSPMGSSRPVGSIASVSTSTSPQWRAMRSSG